MKNAVIYARFSSDKQDEASIDAQVRACREYAAGKGYAVLEVYADEAVSGKGSKTASRKAYQRMLRDVNKGLFDTILIHKYDRVARNLGEHVNLEKRLKDRHIQNESNQDGQHEDHRPGRFRHGFTPRAASQTGGMAAESRPLLGG